MNRALPILGVKLTSPAEFIDFWSSHYLDPNEQIYQENLSKPLTPESVNNLFIWKNGGPLSRLKQKSIEENYINRLDELLILPKDTSASEFLHIFKTGGAIWRIFWLHCWQPKLFPIYDMHVHRAMSYLETGNPEEISTKSDKWKIETYVNRYLPFCEYFSKSRLQAMDQALWTFGKHLKTEMWIYQDGSDLELQGRSAY